MYIISVFITPVDFHQILKTMFNPTSGYIYGRQILLLYIMMIKELGIFILSPSFCSHKHLVSLFLRFSPWSRTLNMLFWTGNFSPCNFQCVSHGTEPSIHLFNSHLLTIFGYVITVGFKVILHIIYLKV